MTQLETRLKELEVEVETLRAELRLIKRKFRNVDPYRNRQAIENVVSEMLDRRSWKMVSTFDPSYPDTVKSSSSRRSRVTGMKSEIGILTDDELNLSEDDPLDVCKNLFATLSDDEGSNEDEPANERSIAKNSRPSGLPKMLKDSDVEKHRRTTPRRTSAEFKIMACQRAYELGSSTKAGRELNVSESNIRAWRKALIASGHQFEKSTEQLKESTTEEISSNLHSDLQPKNEGSGISPMQEFTGLLVTTTPTDVAELSESDSSTSSVHPPKEKKPKPPGSSAKVGVSTGRIKTSVWEFFTTGVSMEGRKRPPMLCHFCHAEVSAEASRLRKHLERCPKYQP